MRNTELALINKIDQHLFDSSENAENVLSKDEIQIKTRWMALYAANLENPLMTSDQKIDFLTSGGGGTFQPVSKSVAYSDIRAVNILLGNIQTASKNWLRHIFIENILQLIEHANNYGSISDRVKVLDKLGKYAKLDQDDTDQFDFSKIIPPSFEPSDDVTLVEGAVKIENVAEYRKKLRQKFGKVGQIVDAQIIEFSDGESS